MEGADGAGPTSGSPATPGRYRRGPPPPSAGTEGVEVTAVVAGSPAAAAGLRIEDLIVEVLEG